MVQMASDEPYKTSLFRHSVLARCRLVSYVSDSQQVSACRSRSILVNVGSDRKWTERSASGAGPWTSLRGVPMITSSSGYIQDI